MWCQFYTRARARTHAKTHARTRKHCVSAFVVCASTLKSADKIEHYTKTKTHITYVRIRHTHSRQSHIHTNKASLTVQSLERHGNKKAIIKKSNTSTHIRHARTHARMHTHNCVGVREVAVVHMCTQTKYKWELQYIKKSLNKIKKKQSNKQKKQTHR